METIKEWIDRVTNHEPILSVSQKTGMNQPTLSRQIKENRVTPETIKRIARAYDASLIEGYIRIGLLTVDDIKDFGVKIALEEASDIELAEENLARAIKQREQKQ